MGSHKRKKSRPKMKLEEIKYEDIPKYAKKRKREESIKKIGKSFKKIKRKTVRNIGKTVKKTKKSIISTREKSKPILKRIGENVKKGIEFEKEAFKFGGKAVSKGWEWGFEKPLKMREKAQREMEKQRKELGF